MHGVHPRKSPRGGLVGVHNPTHSVNSDLRGGILELLNVLRSEFLLDEEAPILAFASKSDLRTGTGTMSLPSSDGIIRTRIPLN